MSQSPERAETANTLEYRNAWSSIQNMIQEGLSWSGRERNCSFLHTGGPRFADVSAITGLDFDDDARAAGMVDWDHDGDVDLWIANRTGPRLRFLRNNAGASKGFVQFLLRGTKCNRDAIGARVELYSPAGRRIQTLRAGEGFIAQSSKWLHFGLNGARAIDKLVVRWPGGAAETFTGLTPNGRHVIEEGSGAARPWLPPDRSVALTPSKAVAPPVGEQARVLLSVRPPMPALPYRSFDGAEAVCAPQGGKAVLVNLWASWCIPCAKELAEFAAAQEDLAARGVELLALTVDKEEDRAKAREQIAKVAPKIATGIATDETKSIVEIMQRALIELRRPLALPTSVLIDSKGRLAAIYRGAAGIERLRADAALLPLEGAALRDAAVPFPGLWYSAPHAAPVDRLARDFMFFGHPEIAMSFLANGATSQLPEYGEIVDADFQTRGDIFLLNGDLVAGRGDAQGGAKLYAEAIKALERELALKPNNSEALHNLGVLHSKLGRLEEALALYRRALPGHAVPATVYINMVRCLRALGRNDEAIEHLRKAIEFQPRDVALHMDLASYLIQLRRIDEVEQCFRKVLEIDPKHVRARQRLAEFFFHKQNFPESERIFREALELAPNDQDVQLGFARVLMRTGRGAEGIALCEKVLAAHPRNLDGIIELGMHYSREKKYDRALGYFEQGLVIAPDNAALQFAAGISQVGLGRAEAAAATYRRLVKLDPKQAATLKDQIRKLPGGDKLLLDEK
ncbi:MAG: tetratricopeptide repeat protein [Planctomycetes bacterium]|nr:tetratricopeptide repeat protein [Planctomycetota bacterium]